MNSNRWSGFPVFATGLIAMASVLAQSAWGQPKVPQTPQVVIISLNNAEKDKGAEVKEVDLRPHTPTELGFDVRNNAGEVLGDVTLKIVQVVNKQDRVLAETTIPKIDPTPELTKGVLVQMFNKIKGAPDKLELAGAPPYMVQVHVQGKNLPLIKRDLKFVVREPKDYVVPTVKYNLTDNALNVEVAPKEGRTFLGLHLLPVQLVLGPDLKATKKGIFKQTLTMPDQRLSLVADEVLFERSLTEGDVYLKVDGYDRAFTFPVRENAGGAIEPRPAGEIRVRIAAPRYARPNPKFEVPLEIDGPLSADYKLRVGLDRTGDTEDPRGADLLELTGLRRQNVTLSFSKEGALVCEAEVRDWTAQFDTGDIFSRNVKIRVSVVKDKEKVKLAVASESRPLMARLETDDREKEIKSIFAQVTVDESAPDGLKIEIPKDKDWIAGEPLELRTSIKPRTSMQAPIAKVIVFRGKAPKSDKDEIKGDDIFAVEEVADPKQKDWKFTLPAQEKAEPLTFSVQFVTHTGGKATITETVSLKPAVAAKKLYKIKGKVVRGPLGQPGVEVTLIDAKKMVKGSAKTDTKGVFVFENVEPGAYTVSSIVAVENLLGSAPINVPDKEKKDPSVTISLLKK